MTEPEIFFGGAPRHGLEVFPLDKKRRDLIRQLDGSSGASKKKLFQYFLIAEGKATYYVFQYHQVKTSINDGRPGSSLSIWLKFDGIKFKEFTSQHKEFFQDLLEVGLIETKKIMSKSKQDEYTLYYQVNSFSDRSQDLHDIILGGKDMFKERFLIEDFCSVNRKDTASQKQELGFKLIPKPPKIEGNKTEQQTSQTLRTAPAAEASHTNMAVPSKITNDLNQLVVQFRKLFKLVALLTILLIGLLIFTVGQYAGIIPPPTITPLAEVKDPVTNTPSSSNQPQVYVPPQKSVLEDFLEKRSYPECCYVEFNNSLEFSYEFPINELKDWKEWDIVPLNGDDFLEKFARGLIILDKKSRESIISINHDKNSLAKSLKTNTGDIMNKIKTGGDCSIDNNKTVYDIAQCVFESKRDAPRKDPILFNNKPN